MDDTQIIDLYWDRDQGAITATAGKYGSFLHALSWNILRSHHDAEECVNDTYFRAWNAMPPERPGALRAWLGRITRNLSLDRWKAGRTQSRGAGMETLLGELDECIPDHRGPEQAAEERVLAECVSAGREPPIWLPAAFAVMEPAQAAAGSIMRTALRTQQYSCPTPGRCCP